MPLVIDDYTVASFNAVASNSAHSDTDRIVIEKGEIVAKGFWQQCKMAFMSNTKRRSINNFVIKSFVGALKQEYGQNVYNKAVEDGSMACKLNKGTKLLSRDIRYYINKCQQQQAVSKPDFKSGGDWPDYYD